MKIITQLRVLFKPTRTATDGIKITIQVSVLGPAHHPGRNQLCLPPQAQDN
jgi:hypothetical protein